MTTVEKTALEGVLKIIPKRFEDARGFFSETYNAHALAEAGIVDSFVQDNHSLSAAQGTVRGLHYQSPPRAQGKLVRVCRGAIRDVAVDARKGSPTFGRHVAVELSAGNGAQLYVPAGFLHGFVTLEPYTEVIYKVTDFYSGPHDGGVRWNDPALAIDWGITEAQATLSDKDARARLWTEFESPF